MFPTTGNLASWAGLCPGHNESAGRRKPSHAREGNKHLGAALGVAALSASRSKGTFLAARYRRIVAGRGKLRAVVAIEHTILVMVWNMLRNEEAHQDPGADHYTRRDPARVLRQLHDLGCHVTLTPVAARAHVCPV